MIHEEVKCNLMDTIALPTKCGRYDPYDLHTDICRLTEGQFSCHFKAVIEFSKYTYCISQNEASQMATGQYLGGL